MLTREEITRILKEKYPYLASEYGIKRIGLFGSFAKGIPTEKSDIDIIMEFDRPIGFRFVELSEHLERILGRRVDIITPGGIQGIRIDHIAKNIEENIVYV